MKRTQRRRSLLPANAKRTRTVPKRPHRLRPVPHHPLAQFDNPTTEHGRRRKQAAFREEIENEFAQFKIQKTPEQVNFFIERAEGFSPIFEFLTNVKVHAPGARKDSAIPTKGGISTKEMRDRLLAAETAASNLLSAITTLCESGESFDRLISSGRALTQWGIPGAQREALSETSLEGQMQLLAVESAKDGHIQDLALMWGGQELMLRRLWAYAHALQIQAHLAQQDLKPSRGNRVVERHARLLAKYLHESWIIVFNEHPKTRRDGDFHCVAKIVGRFFNLSIGGKIVSAINSRD